MLDALEVCTTVVVGVMVGVEFSVAFVVNPILDALPDDSGPLGRAHGGRMLGVVMPVWYLTSLVLVVVWAVAGRHHDGTGLVVTAGALLAAGVLLSIQLLVPINNGGRTWTPENRPADWKQQTHRWDRLHRVRVAVIVTAFAVLVSALVRQGGRAPRVSARGTAVRVPGPRRVPRTKNPSSGCLIRSVRGIRGHARGPCTTRRDGALSSTEREVIILSTMRQPPPVGPGRSSPHGADEPVSELVQRASHQLTELVRGELRLAQAEMKEKGKRYGKGGGLFGGAGVVGFLMLQALVATAIAGLAVVLPVWAAALIVTAVLGVIAAVMALSGKKQVDRAAPPRPEQTVESVKADVAEIKESAHR